jgi:Family of unknown function (DUF6421)
MTSTIDLPLARSQAARICNDLARPVDAFRLGQDATGRVINPDTGSREQLTRIKETACAVFEALGLTEQKRAWEADIADWLAAGLDSIPYFDRTRDSFEPPANGGSMFFIAPFLSTNGPEPVGRRLDFFLATREEPEELHELYDLFPHPKNACQSVRLVGGSAGLMTGNCIVFFPENVQARTKVQQQSYAIFFFNKFHKIYGTHTRGAVNDALGHPPDQWTSFDLDPVACYHARCVWGYLHDYYHHQGPRPFDTNIAVKLNWFVGLLEEVKVDCQTIISCLTEPVPYGREVAEFAIFDRIFRYPLHPENERNFDSGTGVLLFEYLRSAGVITAEAGDQVLLDWGSLVPALENLVGQIEALERRVETDDEYKDVALQFVRGYMPENVPPLKFAFTADQEILRRGNAAATILNFGDLPY